MRRQFSRRRKELGQTLRSLRKRSDLGLKSVAPKVSVSYTYLSKIENGHKLPSAELVEKLCGLYNTDPDELISRLGQLPSDIQRIVESHGKEVFTLLRERYSDQNA